MVQFNESDIVFASLSYSLVLVIGTSGNLILLISILFRKEARKKQSNIFLISLSLTDFLTSTICGPYYLRSLHVSEFIHDDGNQLLLCSIMLVNVYFFAIESILSLALMSLDRFFAVRMPFWYQRNVTMRSCIAVTCVCWAYGMMTVFPAFFNPDWVVYENQPGSPCGFKWGEASAIFIGLNFLVSFVIPTIVIFVTNVLVFKTAKEQNRKINICPVNRANVRLSRANRAQSEPRSRPLSAADVSKHKLMKRTPGENIATDRSFKERSLTSPSRLTVHSVSAKSSQIAMNIIHPSSAQHRVIRSLSLNKIDSLGTSENVNPQLRWTLTQPDSMEAEYKYLSARRTSETDIPSNTRQFDQPYDWSEGRLGNGLRKPKGYVEKDRVKRPLRNQNEGSNCSKGAISPRREMKLVLATISISVAFFVSWMPFVIPRVLLLVSETDVSDRILNYGIIFSVMSSAWNPYVLLLTRKELLLGFKKVFKQFENKIFGRS